MSNKTISVNEDLYGRLETAAKAQNRPVRALAGNLLDKAITAPKTPAEMGLVYRCCRALSHEPFLRDLVIDDISGGGVGLDTLKSEIDEYSFCVKGRACRDNERIGFSYQEHTNDDNPDMIDCRLVIKADDKDPENFVVGQPTKPVEYTGSFPRFFIQLSRS